MVVIEKRQPMTSEMPYSISYEKNDRTHLQNSRPEYGRLLLEEPNEFFLARKTWKRKTIVGLLLAFISTDVMLLLISLRYFPYAMMNPFAWILTNMILLGTLGGIIFLASTGLVPARFYANGMFLKDRIAGARFVMYKNMIQITRRRIATEELRFILFLLDNAEKDPVSIAVDSAMPGLEALIRDIRANNPAIRYVDS